MVRALSLVPDTGDNSSVVIVNDYASTAEALGIEQPEPGASDDDVADWFIPITTGRDDTVGGLLSNTFFNNDPLDDASWRDEIGWAPVDVDIAVEVPPNDQHTGYYAFIGDFDPDAIDDAVTDDDNPWADELHQDGDTYVWGDDPEAVDTERVTTVRPLGRGGSMAVLDEHTILWSWSPDALEDGIAAAHGDADSLADSDELAPLAAAMDDADALGALFSSDAEQFEGSGDSPSLEPYDAFATGTRLDPDLQTLVTLLHADDDAAASNVDAIEDVVDEGTSSRTNAPWSELVSLADAQAQGPVTTIVLDNGDTGPTLWANVVFTQDSLLAT